MLRSSLPDLWMLQPCLPLVLDWLTLYRGDMCVFVFDLEGHQNAEPIGLALGDFGFNVWSSCLILEIFLGNIEK